MSHEHLTIVTRAEALAQGLTRFYTGKPCKHGNIAERNVNSRKCLCPDCRATANNRRKAWGALNPDRVAAVKADWAAKNAEHVKQRKAEYYKANRDRILGRVKAAYLADPDAVKKRVKEWQANNPQKLREYHLSALERDGDGVRAKRACIQSKRNRVIGAAACALSAREKDQMQAIYRLRATLTRETGIEYHVDHYIPLAKGGLHHPDNLWVIPAVENFRKSSKLPSRYAPSVQR